MLTTHLFNPDSLPLTCAAGFIEADSETVVRAFEKWMAGLEREQKRTTCDGELSQGLEKLLPMTWPSTRCLFWSTRSAWTLFLDNAGGDAVPTVASYLAGVLGCRGLRIVWSPHIRFKEQRGEHGAAILEVYEPDGKGGTITQRAISKVYESQWSYDIFGTPLPFERYSDAELRKRWRKELLIEYAQQLGVALNHPAFFGRSGVVYQELADWVRGVRTQTLEQAQHGMRLHEVDFSTLR